MMPAVTSPWRTAAAIPPRATDLVDRAHVQRVTAFDPLARARHAEGGAEQRRFEIVHRDGVAPEKRLDVAVLDEPDHVLAGARVHDRGTHHPADPAAPLPLLS